MDFEHYKEKFPQKAQRITELEKKYKKSEITLSLKENQAVRDLISELESIVKTINSKLLSYDKLEYEERERLLADKERCMWFLNKFPDAQLTIDRINSYLEKL